MKQLLLFLLLFALSTRAEAQGTLLQQRQYGGTGDEESVDMIQMQDGTFTVAGRSTSSNFDVPVNFGLEDIYIINVDASLDTVWTRVVGGSAEDTATDLIETDSGDIMVVGSTYSDDNHAAGSAGMQDVLLVKLSADGTLLWTKTYGGSLNDVISSITQVEDGFLMAGYTGSPEIATDIAMDDLDAWVMKIDQEGELQWNYTIGGSKQDKFNSLVLSSNGDIMLAGQSQSSDGPITESRGYIDAWLVALDANADFLWSRNFGGLAGDVIVDVIRLQDGNFAALCETRSFDGDVVGNHGNEDFWLLKLDPQGEIIWQNTFGGSLQDSPFSLSENQAGDIIMIGSTISTDGDVSTDQDNFNIFLCAANGQTGDLLWAKAVGGSNTDFGISVVPLEDQKLMLNGFTQSLDGDFGGKHGAHEIWLSLFEPGSPDAIVTSQQIDLKLYPNPSKEKLSISSKIPIDEIRLFNINAQLLESWQLRKAECSLNLQLGSGTYFLQIDTKEGTLLETFVVTE